MNVIEEIKRINEIELSKGITNTNASWHCKYANSAWIFIGNIPHNLTEGDIICVFSQLGEVEDFNLVRDETTGKSRGFAFLKYEDARSCILAVDNLTGSKVSGRSLRVDHVEHYRLPKHLQDKRKLEEEESQEGDLKKYFGPGHAYIGQELATSFHINEGQDLFAPPLSSKKIRYDKDEDEKDPYEKDKSLKRRQSQKKYKSEVKQTDRPKDEKKRHKRERKHRKRKDSEKQNRS